MEYAEDHYLFPLIREPHSRWEKAGLSPRAERSFNRVATLLMAVFLTGWTYSFILAESGELGERAPVATISRSILRSPLAADAPAEPAFVVDEFVRGFAEDFEAEVRGQSGAVNVAVMKPGEELNVPASTDSLPGGAAVELRPAEGTTGAPVAATGPTPSAPGVWNVVLRMADAIRPASDVSVITLVPLSAKTSGRIGTYRVGSWPFERGGATKPIYEPPAGLVRVTPENQDLWLSEHVQLKDFLTKGQQGVWPKYVALQPKVLDKVELTIQELGRMGYPVKNIFVVSAFRTPSYNEGGGNTAGRASLSRHMYGDAVDFAIDNDNDTRMDDINRDGRVDVGDARMVAQAAERVEKKYPSMIGGIGVYRPTGAHSGFVHLDTRGFRARW
ncbi:MAG TPA: D-Ala-D-Ala carboxypeptidase family metallohydrolase [Longimicrobium sp.]|nr:D-Ala-D-Ala carboxypeptidase family metallohydrolase [Longimicrobium sp.]